MTTKAKTNTKLEQLRALIHTGPEANGPELEGPRLDKIAVLVRDTDKVVEDYVHQALRKRGFKSRLRSKSVLAELLRQLRQLRQDRRSKARIFVESDLKVAVELAKKARAEGKKYGAVEVEVCLHAGTVSRLKRWSNEAEADRIKINIVHVGKLVRFRCSVDRHQARSNGAPLASFRLRKPGQKQGKFIQV